jgi:hypothetical protein
MRSGVAPTGAGSVTSESSTHRRAPFELGTERAPPAKPDRMPGEGTQRRRRRVCDAGPPRVAPKSGSDRQGTQRRAGESATPARHASRRRVCDAGPPRVAPASLRRRPATRRRRRVCDAGPPRVAPASGSDRHGGGPPQRDPRPRAARNDVFRPLTVPGRARSVRAPGARSRRRGRPVAPRRNTTGEHLYGNSKQYTVAPGSSPRSEMLDASAWTTPSSEMTAQL